MKTLLFFCVLFLTRAAFGQTDTINQLDGNGLKQGYWIHYGEEHLDQGFPLNAIYSEGVYVNDKKQGYWKRYHINGSIRLLGHYENDKPCGDYTKYFEDGTIEEEGTYCNDKYFGELKRYHPNGVLKYRSKYSQKGVEIDTTFYYSEVSTVRNMIIHDSVMGISQAISYNDFGEITDFTVEPYSCEEKPFRLKNFIDTTQSVSEGIAGTYYCIMTYSGTPIYQEFILIIHSDLHYEVVSYNYEQCYGTLHSFEGTITDQVTEIEFSERGPLPKYLNKESFGFESVPVTKYRDHRVTFRFKKGKLNPDFRIPKSPTSVR
ncbi:MAG: hypothetical protein NXI10_02415 [bacterium]|nr:hypothetical protein [bacterium]